MKNTTATTPRRKRLRAGIALLGVLAVGGVGASALWSDTAQVETTVTSGSFDIDVNGDQGNPVPYVLPADLSNIKPGDRVSTVLTVRNNGTVPARVSLAYLNVAGASTPVADALQVEYSAPRPTTPNTDPRLKVGNISLGQTPSQGRPATDPLAPGDSVDFTVTIIAPEDFPSELQGVSERIVLRIGATHYFPPAG